MSKGKIEKYLLRKAFENENIIPDSILNRQKEAFSDGVSKSTDSWYKIIQNHIEDLVSDEEFLTESLKFTFCVPETKESYYYRKIFHHFYNNQYIIPNFWKPRWVEQMDPSARELAIYAE
jgi:asparagine synthase (glutamine-hydrolysing)